MKSKICQILLLTKCAKCGIISPGRARALRPEFDKNLTYGKFSVESAGLSIWPKISRKCGHRSTARASPLIHMAYASRKYNRIALATRAHTQLPNQSFLVSLAARTASG